LSTIAPLPLPADEPDAEHASAVDAADHLPCVAFRLLQSDALWPPVFSYLSARSGEIFGVEPAAILLDASILLGRILPEDAAPLQAAITNAFTTMGQWRHEIRLRCAGAIRWFECCGRVHLQGNGAPCADGYLTDITERKAAELEHERIHQRLVRAFEATPQPMGIVDEAGNIMALNAAFVQIIGYTLEECPTFSSLIGRLVPDGECRADLRKTWYDYAQRFRDTRVQPEPIVAKVLCKDGAERMIEARSTWTAGQAVVLLIDITERLASEDRLRLWTSVLEQTSEGIMICDAQGRMLTVNPAFERLTGYSKQEVLGQTAQILHSGRQDATFYADMWATLETSGQWSGEVWNRRKSGELYVEWLTINTVYDAPGRIAHYVGVFSDITARKAAEERLRYLAQYDALTDLANRSLLLRQLEQLIELAARSRFKVYVLFVDLDHFKNVNDSMGHEAGDQLLQAVARRIKDTLRQSDTVARMGGDEFVMLLSGLRSADDAARLAQQLLTTICTPVLIKDQEVSVSASIGICEFPGDGAQASDLIRNADTAMYRAKSAGRNRYEFYASEMNLNTLERLQSEKALRLALDRQEFVLHYQPQIDLASGTMVGAEALIRWNRPNFGLVPPDQFIPLAQECGLIVAIGRWVIGEALRQIKAWDAAGAPPLIIAVNVSVSEFHERGFVANLMQAIQDNGVEPARLELELTESAAVQNVEGTTAILDRLHEIGIRLTLDDFGTGYSSMNRLRRFPIDRIKIDKSFVAEMTDKVKSVRLVRAIILLAKSLGMKVIAEGVETAEQLAALRAEQCDEIQGYLVSPALEPVQFDHLLRTRKRYL
jgi:diguanylate cyclase (GGDEF)-like protein/PAS domain S-box-containing protein